MRIEVENIKVAARIRKLTARIDELAQDIQKNGLINPITVMAVEGGYQLLAGLRRLRAAQSLGWTEIEATVAAPKDAEAALFIEHSENVQREAFTFSEKMDYGRLIEEIEKAKAQERASEGHALGGSLAGKGRPKGDSFELARAQSYVDEGKRKPQSRDVVGEKIGMSGQQYSRAKYVADHAPQELIDELDRGERTIFGTYEDLRTTKKSPNAEASSAEATASAKKVEVESLSPKPIPETDLQRAIRAESELDAFKYRQHNEIYHRETIIENLKMRIAELEDALTAANARIRELEDKYKCES